MVARPLSVRRRASQRPRPTHCLAVLLLLTVGAPAAYALPDAINQSLLTNPDLVALRGRIEVNQAMVGVARTYPWNPFVQGQFLPQGKPFVPPEPGVPASAAGQSNYYVWVMQR